MCFHLKGSNRSIFILLAILFLPHLWDPVIAAVFGILIVVLLVMEWMTEQAMEDRRYLREKLETTLLIEQLKHGLGGSSLYMFAEDLMNAHHAPTAHGSTAHVPSAFTAILEEEEEEEPTAMETEQKPKDDTEPAK